MIQSTATTITAAKNSAARTPVTKQCCDCGQHRQDERADQVDDEPEDQVSLTSSVVSHTVRAR